MAAWLIEKFMADRIKFFADKEKYLTANKTLRIIANVKEMTLAENTGR